MKPILDAIAADPNVSDAFKDGVKAAEAKHTPGPWEYVPSNENHGPYVVGPFGGDIADCYTMSNLRDSAICNGGTSKPIPFFHEMADPNARLIAAAPDMYEALKECRDQLWHLAKDKINNPWLKQASAALAKARGES